MPGSIGCKPLTERTRRAGAADSLAPTIYHEDWWLRAATADAWEEAVVTLGGRLVGRLPYQELRKTRWHTALVMPPMTHSLGPAVARLKSSETAGLARQVSVTSELIARLPPASHVWFRLHAGASNALAFEQAGFSTGLDYTVRIACQREDALWRGMRDKTRNVIRRAEEVHDVTVWTEADRFLDFYEGNLRAKGLRNLYERAACERVIEAALARDRACLWVASDSLGDPRAAILTVWDAACEYYHMSTRSPEASNGATSLLLWSAIRHASVNGRYFDVDGLHPSNLLFGTGFGGELVPQLRVWRETRAFAIARRLDGLRSG